MPTWCSPYWLWIVFMCPSGKPLFSGASADLVPSLDDYSSDMDQTEQGEQVHNVVEDEHLSLLSVRHIEYSRNISRGDRSASYSPLPATVASSGVRDRGRPSFGGDRADVARRG